MKMTLICPNCGEKERFEKKVYGVESYEELHAIDKYGDVVDMYDCEVYDKQIKGSDMPICLECQECVEDLNHKEYIQLIWEHTNKKGEWHKDKLPEDKRDPEILEKAISEKV